MTEPQNVKVRYDWRIRLKNYASYAVHYGRPVIVWTLQRYSQLVDAADYLIERTCYGYSAGAYTDLSLAEFLRVRWCEFRGGHVGRRINMHRGFTMHYCAFCQCEWKKFGGRKPRSILRSFVRG